jgi:hypothetical protein
MLRVAALVFAEAEMFAGVNFGEVDVRVGVIRAAQIRQVDAADRKQGSAIGLHPTPRRKVEFDRL